jgi:hypothetical protein
MSQSYSPFLEKLKSSRERHEDLLENDSNVFKKQTLKHFRGYLERVHFLTQQEGEKKLNETSRGRGRLKMHWDMPVEFTQGMFLKCLAVARNDVNNQFFVNSDIRRKFCHVLENIGSFKPDEKCIQLNLDWADKTPTYSEIVDGFTGGETEGLIQLKYSTVGSPWAKKAFLFQYLLFAFWYCLPLYKLILEDGQSNTEERERFRWLPQEIFMISDDLLAVKPYLSFVSLVYGNLIGESVSERQIQDYIYVSRCVSAIEAIDRRIYAYSKQAPANILVEAPWNHPRASVDINYLHYRGDDDQPPLIQYRDRSGLLLCADIVTKAVHKYTKQVGGVNISEEVSANRLELKSLLDLWLTEGLGRTRLLEKLTQLRESSPHRFDVNQARQNRYRTFEEVRSKDLDCFFGVIKAFEEVEPSYKLIFAQYFRSYDEKFVSNVEIDDKNYLEVIALFQVLRTEGSETDSQFEVIHFVYYHGFSSVRQLLSEESVRSYQEIESEYKKKSTADLCCNFVNNIRTPNQAKLSIRFAGRAVDTGTSNGAMLFELHNDKFESINQDADGNWNPPEYFSYGDFLAPIVEYYLKENYQKNFRKPIGIDLILGQALTNPGWQESFTVRSIEKF